MGSDNGEGGEGGGGCLLWRIAAASPVLIV